jgi:2-polyprenyl-6-methoxyphenol hydroxylase-like FAD-dependent oxidoreductase
VRILTILQYGKHLDHIESDGKVATAIFEDGTREVGNLLIGAEGAHSKVRSFLLGSERSALQMSSIISSATITKLPAEAALRFSDMHPRFMILLHPNGYFAWIGGKSSAPTCRSLSQGNPAPLTSNST